MKTTYFYESRYYKISNISGRQIPCNIELLYATRPSIGFSLTAHWIGIIQKFTISQSYHQQMKNYYLRALQFCRPLHLRSTVLQLHFRSSLVTMMWHFHFNKVSNTGHVPGGYKWGLPKCQKCNDKGASHLYLMKCQGCRLVRSGW